jgi:hypothetical protein
MNRRQLLANLANLAAVGAASALPLPAWAGAQQNFVGSWLGTITAMDPPLGQFNDLISFHAEGVVTESRRYSIPGTPLGNLLETTGHGAWERKGRNSFEVYFRFLLQDADSGAPLGTDNVHLDLILDRVDGTLAGSFESQVKDTAGTVLMTVTGSYAAVPIAV